MGRFKKVQEGPTSDFYVAEAERGKKGEAVSLSAVVCLRSAAAGGRRVRGVQKRGKKKNTDFILLCQYWPVRRRPFRFRKPRPLPQSADHPSLRKLADEPLGARGPKEGKSVLSSLACIWGKVALGVLENRESDCIQKGGWVKSLSAGQQARTPYRLRKRD